MMVKCAVFTVTMLCGTFLLPSPSTAEAAQQRPAVKQARSAAAPAATRGAVANPRGVLAGPRGGAAGPRSVVATTRGHGGGRAVLGKPVVAGYHGRNAIAGRLQAGNARVRTAMYAGGMSCVPYARLVTGMQVSGNGGDWWYNAAGDYARDQRPEPGAVLAFRASGGMRSGHVAVVERVVGAREIEIEHANWGGPGIRRGAVMRGVSVVDVSDRNDWTAVRVQVGYDADTLGRTYPTFGFIHNRPERPAITYAASQRYEEVAEAPAFGRAAAAAHSLDLSVGTTRR